MATERDDLTAFIDPPEDESRRGALPPPDGCVGSEAGTGGYGYPLPAFTEVAIAAVGTAAVLPFMQALATQAGNRAFDAARRLVVRWVQDPGSGTRPVVEEGECLRVTDAGDGRLAFEIPPGLPNAALEALTHVDLEALAAPSQEGGKVLIRWDPADCEWKRIAT